MELLTNVLSEKEFSDELHDAMTFLGERGVQDAAISFGFVVDFPDLDDVGVQYTIPIRDVVSFIADRARTKGFRLGVHDCRIDPCGLDARFLFCNDCDVHFTSESAELLDSIRGRWRAKGFKVFPDDLDGM